MWKIIVDRAGRWWVETRTETGQTRRRNLPDVSTAIAAAARMAGGDALTAAAGGSRLPELWQSGPHGLALQAVACDGRDFTGTEFSIRPDMPFPLMWQHTTAESHGGAVLVGFATSTEIREGVPHAIGYFLDTPEGRQARDVLVTEGRLGVSVDPGEVDYVFVGDADTPDAVETMVFTRYEVAGCTIVSFPAFDGAVITVADSPADSAPLPAAAGFRMPEPDDDDERYVLQDDRDPDAIAIPLTIEAEPDASGRRRVYGHAARWGQCHVGYQGTCVSPPADESGYREFHLAETVTDDGPIAHGHLVASCDHADLTLSLPEARDHYAHIGRAWADVRASAGRHGIWISGYVRRGVTDADIEVLRASTISADWRRPHPDAPLEMMALQSVTFGGFPIRREALAAAGGVVTALAPLRPHVGDDVMVGVQHVHRLDTDMEALTAAGVVSCLPCTDAGRAAAVDALMARLRGRRKQQLARARS